jgi:hypothetical protein
MDLYDVVSEIYPAFLRRTQIFLTEDTRARPWHRLLDDTARRGVALPPDIDETCLLLAMTGKTSKPKQVAYDQRAISHMVGAARSCAVDDDACVISTSPVARVSGAFIMLVTMITII